MRKGLMVIGFLVVSMLCFQSSFAMGQFFILRNPLVGEKVKNFTLETTSGVRKSLDQVRGSQSTILFFWTTWCPHCREQIQELSGKIKELQAQKVKLVLVDIEEPREKVDSYLKKFGVSEDVFLDEDGAVSKGYGVVGVPSFYFVNAQGKIMAVEHAIPDDYMNYFK